MQSGSGTSRGSPYPMRNYARSYRDDPYNRAEETQDSSTSTQPGVSAHLGNFSDAALSFAHHNPVNYAFGDFDTTPAWTAGNQYNFAVNHGTANDYELGYSNVGGALINYSGGPSMSYGEHATENSEQNITYSAYQPIRQVPDVEFDLTSFEMPTRTQTRSQVPISSADFVDATVPIIFEDTISDPQVSPTCSRSSRSSFDTARSPSSNMISQMGSQSERSLGSQSASLSTQPTFSSHLSPDASSTKPYRCTQPECSRSYARKFELYRHQRRHTGVKAHHCQVPGCDRGLSNGFYRKDHLRQHMRQVHGT